MDLVVLEHAGVLTLCLVGVPTEALKDVVLEVAYIMTSVSEDQSALPVFPASLEHSLIIHSLLSVQLFTVSIRSILSPLPQIVVVFLLATHHSHPTGLVVLEPPLVVTTVAEVCLAWSVEAVVLEPACVDTLLVYVDS